VNRKIPSHTERTHDLFTRFDRICQRIPSGTQPEAVHRLRTTIRRIETLAAQVEQDASLRKLLKQLAHLSKRAGKVRDIDVQRVALRTVMLESAVTDKRLVMRALNRARAKAERKLVAAVRDVGEHGIEDRLRRAANQLSAPPGPAIVKHYAGAALDKFARLVGNYSLLTRDNLHEFRMECKRVRYLAEMSGGTAVADRIVNECRKIQDAIGEWHDWLTLTGRAEEVLPERNSPLLHVLHMRERSKFAAALPVAAQSTQELFSMGMPRVIQLSQAKMAAAG
jgi:CHAD domain-containing protein